jgi:hypothetical protein
LSPGGPYLKGAHSLFCIFRLHRYVSLHQARANGFYWNYSFKMAARAQMVATPGGVSCNTAVVTVRKQLKAHFLIDYSVKRNIPGLNRDASHAPRFNGCESPERSGDGAGSKPEIRRVATIHGRANVYR